MTDLRSGGRKLSFEVLATTDSFFDDDETFLLRSDSGPPINQGEGVVATKSNRRKRKHKGSKKKKKASDELDLNKCGNSNGFIINSNCRSVETTTAVVYEEAFVPPQEKRVYPVISSVRETPELRQRSSVASVGVGSSGEEAIPMYRIDENVKEVDDSSWTGCVTAKEFDTELMMKQTAEMNVNGHHVGRKLEKDQSLDWKRLMAEKDPNHKFLFERSPVKYFMEEMYGGNSLRMTTTLANEKDRERVYDTIFRMPWRCELLIDVGFFVCLDSFLSLLTVMPIRILTTSWRLLKTRQFKMLSAAELSDFGCFLMLASGVILLQQTDISLIYHMIRGQGTIKLYVVYNVLEIFDKLCQNFGGDVLQTLFNTAEGLANCSPENVRYWLWRFISDEALAVTSSIVHSFILLAQAITLSTCIVAHNNALFALLVSNNFSEIKSNVFKRFSKDNIQSLVYFDSIERFHIASFLIFVLAQNILEAEGPWFENFLYNALVVYICELMIDIIKHSFIAKFNEIKPIVYSEFLEDLCKQTLNIQPENPKKTLTFVPLAPASVVIRVLSPVYAAHIPCGPFQWRIVWVLMLSVMTFVMLTTLKVMIGMGLQKHATWYIKRCQGRKLHTD
ncbi:protein POLLEN DEFECTIVE IN GUIDANCE 1 [Cynara cardunculus var. scolymus]|uniref:protein POLLEN DEFECTIVE IN GUIDANCE 1 n=1 Tax=Cynara cardunculus var. scolymus TaxID=59895 RepID=UPI000D62FDF0|nr:protein POLLEN DEFECTIVE IN GUIDANCE 1 [Cynara cardunculus var. scolymus]XP_024994357.1 protein POLLEN DEFECTIVE IN GUIDANCE 1 [Cynara cardunculus var. scolymus]XP_024994358.1 protein POLLEN DEFECTIVE IN GUIDANCE 1 [Cynara cardunculus var. scolymus]